MSPRRRLLAPICRLLGHRLDTPPASIPVDHAPAWWVARCSRCGEFLWGPAFESGVTR